MPSGDERKLLHTAAYEALTAGFSSGNSLVENDVMYSYLEMFEMSVM